MAAHLCLPSPCCQGQLGKTTGYKNRQGNPIYVDTFDDQVMSATLCHDTWRVRHYNIKVAIVAKRHKAWVELEAEPFELFRDIIPAAVKGRGAS